MSTAFTFTDIAIIDGSSSNRYISSFLYLVLYILTIYSTHIYVCVLYIHIIHLYKHKFVEEQAYYSVCKLEGLNFCQMLAV